MRISDWSSDVCSSDLVIGAAVDREIHVARCEEVHFDARMDIVPHRAMAEILDRDITAEFAVDAFEEIEVERRGHPRRIIIGAFENRHILDAVDADQHQRSEEHTSELQSLMRISYAVFCLKKKK